MVRVDADPTGWNDGSSLVHLLRAVALGFEQRLSRSAREAGVHRTDLKALIALLDARRRGSRFGPGELSASLGMSTQATTAVIKRLLAAGWVEQRPDESDGRRAVLEVTPEAIGMGWTEFGDLVRPIAAAAQELSPDAVDAVRAFLRRVLDGLEPTSRPARPDADHPQPPA